MGVFSKHCRGAQDGHCQGHWWWAYARHVTERERGKDTRDIPVGFTKQGPVFSVFTYGLKTSLRTLSISQIQKSN